MRTNLTLIISGLAFLLLLSCSVENNSDSQQELDLHNVKSIDDSTPIKLTAPIEMSYEIRSGLQTGTPISIDVQFNLLEESEKLILKLETTDNLQILHPVDIINIELDILNGRKVRPFEISAMLLDNSRQYIHVTIELLTKGKTKYSIFSIPIQTPESDFLRQKKQQQGIFLLEDGRRLKLLPAEETTR